MSDASPRRQALWRGWRAEQTAALYLRLKGWRILARNYRCKAGEIDIVARKRDLVAFVEVKARGGASEAVAAVGAGGRRRIEAAARVWLSRQPDPSALSWRFDIVAVAPWRLPRHFEDAF